MNFKNSPLLVLLIIILPFGAKAQRSNLLQRGEAAFDQQNFVSAISFLDEVIEYRNQFSSREIGNALFWRGLSYLELSKKERYSSEYPNALLQVFQDLEEVTNLPVRARISQTAETTLQKLPKLLLEKALQLLEESQGNGIRPAQRQSKSRLALNHTSYAQKLEPNNYLIHSIEGQARLIQRDSSGAFEDLEQSIQAFETNPPELADLNQSKVFALTAMLQQYFFRDKEAAIDAIGQGLRFLEQEKNRITQLSDDQFSSYQTLQKKLQNAELEIYKSDPILLSNTLKDFEKALERNPNNYAQRLAYAKLLSKKDLEAGIEQYQQAIAITQQNFEAQYALGLIFYQKGTTLNQQAEESIKPRTIESKKESAKEQFTFALPFLENVYIQDSSDLAIIAALVKVCEQIGAKEKYKKYRGAQRRVRGY